MSLVVTAIALVSVAMGPSRTTQAHGALVNPGSRTYACFLEGPQNPITPACQAAVNAGGTQPLYDWFGVLRSDGAGRTTGFIPDGQLCSGGNIKYAAYDAARADWPATTLQSGVPFTFFYGAWVPHPGNFRLYVTKDTYNPTVPLKWSDLEAPFLVSNPEPAVVNGAYQMAGMTPAGKTGRHIIYTVWTRSDSNETFYSCSDVVFGKDGNFPTPTPVPVSCTQVVAITNSWQGGFQGSVTVTNTSTAGIVNWGVNWTEPVGITLVSGWNATVIQDTTSIIATAPDWHRTLHAGEAVTIGFVVNGSAVVPPSGVILNGVPCV